VVYNLIEKVGTGRHSVIYFANMLLLREEIAYSTEYLYVEGSERMDIN
jgi:hypothetical protein